jgi:hypothetical protein
MKNNKFKKKFSDRLRKAPHTTERKEAEKKERSEGSLVLRMFRFWAYQD